MKIGRKLAGLGLLAMLAAPLATADTFQGSTHAEFTAYSPANGLTNPWTHIGDANGELHNLITTGQPVSLPNSLEMDKVAHFDTDAGASFVVSHLTYHNGQTQADTSATDLAITIALTFDAPPDISPNPQTFSFTYHLDLTPNNGGPVDDTLTVPSVFPGSTFTIGSDPTEYTLKLLGFKPTSGPNAGGPLTDTFKLPEDQTVTADLYATITTEVAAAQGVAPIPGVASAGLALLGVVSMGKRFRRRA